MSYRIITTESPSGERLQVVITNEDGSIKTFPADPENKEYVDFLAQNGEI